MKSGWFFGTQMWAEYLAEYSKARPECLNEFRSSPLTNDHDFVDYMNTWTMEDHQTQVIDLVTHQWADIRRSYHSIIHRANDLYEIRATDDIEAFKYAHIEANGRQPRPDRTYEINGEWIESGNAMLVGALDEESTAGAYALWILYRGSAYYASGPSIHKNVQHAVVWKSLEILKSQGIRFVEMGQIDGVTEKERNVGKFKCGWGGEAKPFTIVMRKNNGQ